eukprot:TRINITY_DN3927_c0_g1_i1.p1 TRINITY_DN3927_c0_g1~~TRINITY_DN3927_c0_g1_i1.p1  ORF type:complete len:280 (-),score=45.43 TRINITY_DN3927_c0_g1_i1:45-884(-)
MNTKECLVDLISIIHLKFYFWERRSLLLTTLCLPAFGIPLPLVDSPFTPFLHTFVWPPDRLTWINMASGGAGSGVAPSGSVKPFKIVLLGDSAVGKSSLVVRFVEGSFTEHMAATVGAAYLTETVVVDGISVKLEIWDTAGQERYRSLTPLYYKGALGAIIVFDLTNKESLVSASSWVSELATHGEDGIVIALAGNKADKKAEIQVTPKEIEDFQSHNKDIAFYKETSAKLGLNVREIFESLAAEYLKLKAARKPSEAELDDVIATLEAKQKRDGKCCK